MVQLTYSLSAKNVIDCDEVKCYPSSLGIHTHTHRTHHHPHNVIEDIQPGVAEVTGRSESMLGYEF